MSLVKSISELKKGQWYHSPNLWAVDRPNAVEMNKDNAQFIQTLIDKKILFTTAAEASQQAFELLQFVGGDEQIKVEITKKTPALKINDNLDLFGGVA